MSGPEWFRSVNGSRWSIIVPGLDPMRPGAMFVYIYDDCTGWCVHSRYAKPSTHSTEQEAKEFAEDLWYKVYATAHERMAYAARRAK